MFELSNIIFIIATSFQVISAVEVKTSHFPNKALVFQDLSFENTTLYYALCDQSRNQAEKQCTVVREFITFDDVTETRYCDVKLATETSDTVIADGLMVIAFGNDKAIIVWLEETDKTKLVNLEQKAFLRMSIVHITGCRIFHAKLDFDDNQVNIQWYPNFMDIITFKNTFDLVVKNLRVCGRISQDGHCMFTFDDQGHKITGPVVRFDPIYKRSDYFVSGVEPNTFDNGYLLFNNDGSRQNVYLIKQKNSEMIKLWESPAFYKGQVSTSYSIINKAIGVCCLGNSSNNWIFSCWQSQYQGKHLLQTKFDFEPQADVTVLSTLMYNLRGGGFLLMSTVCPSIDCLGVENVYYLTKVDAHDGVAGTIEVEGYKGKCGKTAAQLFENQAGDYCLAILCPSSSHVTGRLDVLTQCYSDDDFSK